MKFFNCIFAFAVFAVSALRADVAYIAHQGEEALAPSHTKAAYRLAAEHKLDYLKLDIRETKDGVIVLQHDDNLNAVYGTNLVIKNATYAEIKANCRPRQKGRYANETICTLDEALSIGKNMQQGVWIDFKSFSPDLADRVFESLEKAEIPKSRMMVATWSRKALDYVAERYPDVRRVAHVHLARKGDEYSSNMTGKKTFPSEIELAQAVAEEARKRGLFGLNVPNGYRSDTRVKTTAEMVGMFKKSGLWVSIWFVNNPVDGNYYRQAGADAFVTMCAANTDRPDGSGGYSFALPEKGIGAHQGEHVDCPPNTVLSLRTAVSKGARMVEFDVQRCKTGEFIVMHDGNLATTTTATGTTYGCSFDHIRSAKIRKGDKIYEDERVPTFDEAIDCLPKEGFWINVHCYGSSNIARDIALKIKEKGRLHQAFISATLPQLKAAKAAVPELLTCNMTRPAGVVNSKPWTDEQNAEYLRTTIENGCNFIQLRQPWARKFSDEAHAAGIKINICSNDKWCNNPGLLRHVIGELDIDFVLTDNLAKILGQYWGLQKKGLLNNDAALRIVGPADGVVVKQLYPEQERMLGETIQEREKYFDGGANARSIRKNKGKPMPVSFSWSGGKPPYRFVLKRLPDGKTFHEATLEEKFVDVDSLEVAREWEWSVSDGTGSASGRFRTDGKAPRLLRIKGVPNARDVGGWVVDGDKRIRQGLLFRTSGLNNNSPVEYYSADEVMKFYEEGKLSQMGDRGKHYVYQIKRGMKLCDRDIRLIKRSCFAPGKERLTEEERSRIMKQYGFKTDIDLRTDTEVYGMKGSPLGETVELVHSSLTGAYGNFANEKSFDCKRKIFRTIFNTNSYPVVFHCIGGADRTGTIAFMIEALLGADDNTLALDYLVTGLSGGGITDATHKKWFDSMAKTLRELPGGTNAEKMNGVFLRMGFSQKEIDDFRAFMLEKK